MQGGIVATFAVSLFICTASGQAAPQAPRLGTAPQKLLSVPTPQDPASLRAQTARNHGSWRRGELKYRAGA
jgi:hypothetical protein